MTVGEFAARVVSTASTRGVGAALREARREGWIGVFRRLDSVGYRRGKNVFDREWDVLIVLDACRVDVLRDVLASGEYPFADADDVGTHASPGSMSAEWMNRTFTPERARDVARTTMITANPYSGTELGDQPFARLDEVWRDGWDEEVGTVRPEVVTDRALGAASDGFDRLVVHYMQPHFPFLTSEGAVGQRIAREVGEGGDGEGTPWDRVAAGEVAPGEVWRPYRASVGTVLDEVGRLLEGVDATAPVISADHANAFGEFGVFGHPRGVAMSAIRTVPWVRVGR